MKLRLLSAMAIMVFSLEGCDRVKTLTDQARQATGIALECDYSRHGTGLANYTFDKEREAEAKALKTDAALVMRRGDTLTFYHDGKVIARQIECLSFYTGSVRLLNAQTHQIEAYPTFSVGAEGTVVVDTDGTPHVFPGRVAASPDGRYLASGEADQNENNEALRITDWTSPGSQRHKFPISCTPDRWAADGLHVTCDRTDPSRFFSEGIVTETADSWQLRETRLNSLPEDPKQPFPPHLPDAPLTFRADIAGPEDHIDGVGDFDGLYWQAHKTTPVEAESASSSSYLPPTRIEDLEFLSDEDRKAEAAAIAAHADRARRDNFLLTLSSSGHPIARFEDRFDCSDGCPIWLYGGTYRLIDPATGKLTTYDHISVSYDEDSDDYLVDHDGRLYYLGYVWFTDGPATPLISPSKRYAATSDQNLNGDGRIVLLDWTQKQTFEVLSSKAIKDATNNCTLLAWTEDDRLQALCDLHPGVNYSRVEIARQPDGRWQVSELETFALTDVELDQRVGNDVLKLKAKAKGVTAKNGAVFYAEPLKDDTAKLSGYKRLAAAQR